MPLTALQVKHLDKPGLYHDSHGLYCQVSPTGTRSWIFRFMRNRRARSMGLGAYPALSLKEAREARDAARRVLQAGDDPIAVRTSQRQQTAIGDHSFKACAERYIDSHRSGWKSAKHADQWTATLECYVYPTIGHLSVAAVDKGHVLQILEQPIDGERFWTARAETASRVRGRIESVLSWAAARGYRQHESINPAQWRGLLDQLLPLRAQVAAVEHQPALPYTQISEFMADLRRREGVASRALEFLILTAARSGDIILAQWSEINEREALWTVPAARLKGTRGQRRRDHTVPLSREALAILADLPREAGNSYVFIGGRAGAPLSTGALAAVLHRMNEGRRWIDPQQGGREIVVHGFRSTFKDWASELTEHAGELSEMALAHSLPDRVEAAYRRGAMLERRRQLMQAWATFCAGRPALRVIA